MKNQTQMRKKVMNFVGITSLVVALLGTFSQAGINHKGRVEGRVWNRQAIGETWRWDEGNNYVYSRAQLIVNGGIIKKDSGRVYGYGYARAASGWGTGSAKTYYGRG